MSGLESKKDRELYVRHLMEVCLYDLMDGDEDLEVDGSEIPIAADQMQLHFLSNVYSAGLDIVVADRWRVFDKDDESTWPSEHTPRDVWIALESAVYPATWSGPQWWNKVSHWMPIEVPSPPSSSETGSKKQ